MLVGLEKRSLGPIRAINAKGSRFAVQDLKDAFCSLRRIMVSTRLASRAPVEKLLRPVLKIDVVVPPCS